MNGATSSASAEADRDADEHHEGQIVLQQRAHRRPSIATSSLPVVATGKPRPGPLPPPVTAPQAPRNRPRPSSICSKDRRLRLSAAHKGWQGAKSLARLALRPPGEAVYAVAKGAFVPFGIVSMPLRDMVEWLAATRRGESGSMQQLNAGITKANTGLDGIPGTFSARPTCPNRSTSSRSPGTPPSARHLCAAAHPPDPGRVHLHAGGPVRPDDRRQGFRRHHRRPDPAADEPCRTASSTRPTRR